MNKRVIAVFMALVMTLTLIPAAVFAEDAGGQNDSEVTEPAGTEGQNEEDQTKEDQNINDQDKTDDKKKEKKKKVYPSKVAVSRNKRILKHWGGKVTGVKRNKRKGSFVVAGGKKKIVKIKANKGFKIKNVTFNGKKLGAVKKVTVSANGKKQSVKVQFCKARVAVMVDPGHAGRYNRGSIRGYWESQMTWKLSRLLKSELEKRNIICGLTKRSLYHDPSLYERGSQAKGYNLFISIHSNWASSGRPDYPLAIVSCKRKNNTRLYKIAQPLGKRLVKEIRKTMKTKQGYQVWIKRLRSGRDWYGVIRSAASVNVPGIILEHSFHSNKRSCLWLMSNRNLKKMAAAEAEVIADYYGY